MDTTLETEEPDARPIKIERTKYRIHCDACKQEFFLILERQFDKEKLADHDGTGYLQGIGRVRVYASGERGESLIEVGWI